jgi:hypothetical protein
MEEIQIAKNMKKMVTIHSHKEMQIKLRFHHTSVRMGVMKNTANNKCWCSSGVKGTLLGCWCECKLVPPL